jgi:hypothetical protein
MFEEFSVVWQGFDCVNHEILLAKLHFYGIQGAFEDWFGFHLSNRKQKGEIKPPHTTKTFFSDWGTLKHEVPLGSNLGPLLFIR